MNIRILNKLLEQEDLLLFSCLLMGIHILVSIFLLPTCECSLACPAFYTAGGVCFATNSNIKNRKTTKQKHFLFNARTSLRISSFFLLLSGNNPIPF